VPLNAGLLNIPVPRTTTSYSGAISSMMAVLFLSNRRGGWFAEVHNSYRLKLRCSLVHCGAICLSMAGDTIVAVTWPAPLAWTPAQTE